MHTSGVEAAQAAFDDLQLEGGSFGKLQEKRLFPVGNPAESLTMLFQFVPGHTSKAWAFNIHICTAYLKALPALHCWTQLFREAPVS